METVSCNLCEGKNTEQLHRIEGFNIVRCKKCGLVYVNPRPDIRSLKALYDREYFHNDEKHSSGRYLGYTDYLSNRNNIEKTFDKRLRTIEKFTGSGRILDVGCALGFFLSAASKRGWDVWGIDLSEYAIGFAQKEFNGRVMNKTLLKCSFSDNYFDAVTYWDVLEHVPDPKSELKEAHRIMKKGGIIGIVVPDTGSYIVKILGKNWPEFRRIREHIYFFNKKTLSAMLDGVGFDVLLTEGVGRIFNIPNLFAECEIYNKFIFRELSNLAKRSFLSKINIYVKPGYKFALYARKR